MAKLLADLFRVAVASTPSNPSTKATKGDKCLPCWKHASRYIRFFPLSASCKHFSGVFTKWVLASVFMTRMSWTLSVLFCHMPRIRRSSFCSVASGGSVPSRSVEPLLTVDLAFGLCTAQPAKMRGSLRTCEEIRSLPSRSATLFQRSLWRAATRPPLLQLRAWQIVNLVLQPSQYLGRSGVSRL